MGHKKHLAPQNSKLDSILFDHDDVTDITAFESDQKKGDIKSFLAVIHRVLRRKRFLLVVVLIAITVLLLVLKHYGLLVPESIVALLKSYPIIAPLIFVLIYALMVTFLLPTLPMNLGAGVIWGAYWGSLFTVIGATTGAAIAFLVARYVASDYLNNKFHNRAWNWLGRQIKRKDWQVVAFTRVNPIFPFGPSSYFFGLTNIRFYRYLISTIIFISPLAVLFASIGHSLNGIILEGDAYVLVRNIFVASVAITLLLILRLLIKRVFSR